MRAGSVGNTCLLLFAVFFSQRDAQWPLKRTRDATGSISGPSSTFIQVVGSPLTRIERKLHFTSSAEGHTPPQNPIYARTRVTTWGLNNGPKPSGHPTEA